MNVKFRNKQGELLAGCIDYQMGDPAIVFVHGFTGNKDESNGLFKSATEYFASRGLNSFRFDMSGCGESEGDFIGSTLEKQCMDLDSALEYLLLNYNPQKVGLVGFSLGAAAAILLGPNVDAYSFWSPAFFPHQDMFPRYDTPEIRKEFEAKGFIDKNGLKIGRRMLDDLKKSDMTLALSRFSKPVQILHGTDDQRIDYRSSQAAADYLICHHELLLIEGADHSYKNNLKYRKKVYEKSADWFLRCFE